MSPMPETPEAAAASPSSQTEPAAAKAPGPPPRDAATAVIARRDGDHPRILMGQRGKGASFMPSKFVFPGGALDPEDHDAPESSPLRPACVARLEKASAPGMAGPLSRAAVRETFEETGLILGRPDPRAAELAETMTDPSWRDFLASGHMPACDRLTFIFRAITPPYRPKRFDARFFLVDADQLASDPEDLSRASGELSHLTWLTIREARDLDLPLITEVVLAEVEEILAQTPVGELPADRPAPFFHHEKERSFYDAL
ncbi:DNA mismatch repair protein MutT [uncultured Albimonas sp.]|uniref:NUDIX hydrolase n=1 Tax=uncultured Albimonas sp. TaxID=1331701 RepID=UPI0030EDA7F8